MMAAHFSYAQLDLQSISACVAAIDKVEDNVMVEYDETSNSVHFYMHFYDAESFSVFSHFKSTDEIFHDSLLKLNKTGRLDEIIDLGVSNIVLAIRSEQTGNILASKELSFYGFEVKRKIVVANNRR
jgi:hypothetical protein